MDRVSETQLQVGENSNWIIWALKGWYHSDRRIQARVVLKLFIPWFIVRSDFLLNGNSILTVTLWERAPDNSIILIYWYFNTLFIWIITRQFAHRTTIAYLSHPLYCQGKHFQYRKFCPFNQVCYGSASIDVHQSYKCLTSCNSKLKIANQYFFPATAVNFSDIYYNDDITLHRKIIAPHCERFFSEMHIFRTVFKTYKETLLNIMAGMQTCSRYCHYSPTIVLACIYNWVSSVKITWEYTWFSHLKSNLFWYIETNTGNFENIHKK